MEIDLNLVDMILVLLNVFVIGILNGIMDAEDFHLKDTWLGKYKWFRSDSYNLKWKMQWYEKPGMIPYLALIGSIKSPWYYFGLYTPKYVERFPFSSTVMVFTTDGWHFIKWLMFTITEINILWRFNLNWWQMIVGILILKTVRGIGFFLMFNKILLKK
jgi:hypothetical protein